MEAFYICIVFLGIVIVIVAFVFIMIDAGKGKDFFNEFDRKKEEMFNLIQDSEDMIQELNKMSDYVVNIISEKSVELTKNIDMIGSSAVIESQVVKNNQVVEENSVVPDNQAAEENIVVPDNQAVVENNVAQSKQVDLDNPIIIEKLKVDLVHSNNYIKSQQNEVQERINSDILMQKSTYKKNDKRKIIDELDDTLDNKFDAKDDKQRMVNLQFTTKEEDTNEIPASTRKSRIFLNERHRAVMNLIEMGFSDEQISRKLTIGKGEIELIRGLSK